LIAALFAILFAFTEIELHPLLALLKLVGVSYGQGVAMYCADTALLPVSFFA
jgi:hypothetical protein